MKPQLKPEKPPPDAARIAAYKCITYLEGPQLYLLKGAAAGPAATLPVTVRYTDKSCSFTLCDNATNRSTADPEKWCEHLKIVREAVEAGVLSSGAGTAREKRENCIVNGRKRLREDRDSLEVEVKREPK